MKRIGAVLLGAWGLLGGCQPSSAPEVELVQIAAGTVRYQLPAAAQSVTEQVAALRIMQRQVSAAEYAVCVRAGGCAAVAANEAAAGEHPVVGLSWLDATAYARWLSAVSGHLYRLPRYAEWLQAVGEAYVVDPALEADPRNPARRWLAEYAREALRMPPSLALLRFAEQGRSVSGALGVADNVWEWTDSCFAGASAADGFCGIRIAAGRHPSALTDFIRDPVSGACSVGTPPSHVGLRLVRE